MKLMIRILAFILLLATGCIDEVPIDLPFNEPILVADVLVSSDSEASSITIGWTFPSGSECFQESPFGQQPVPCGSNNSSGPYKVEGKVLITDLTSGENFLSEFLMKDREGFNQYKPGIAGVPGHQYALTIEISYDGTKRMYSSESYMHATPMIEKIEYEIRPGDVGKSDDFVPLISFTDPPDEDNYYLFQVCHAYQGGTSYCGNNRVWSYSVLSDELLPEHVSGLSVDAGATVAKYAAFYPDAYPGNGAEVRMYSVHREVYNFYKALLAQFDNDGGAYSPTPATPKGNIKGDKVIGLFRAVQESRGAVFYE
jgi:hypothetical protein